MLLITISITCNITPNLEISKDIRLTNVTEEMCYYLIVCLIFISYIVSSEYKI